MHTKGAFQYFSFSDLKFRWCLECLRSLLDTAVIWSAECWRFPSPKRECRCSSSYQTTQPGGSTSCRTTPRLKTSNPSWEPLRCVSTLALDQGPYFSLQPETNIAPAKKIPFHGNHLLKVPKVTRNAWKINANAEKGILISNVLCFCLFWPLLYSKLTTWNIALECHFNSGQGPKAALLAFFFDSNTPLGGAKHTTQNVEIIPLSILEN